MTLLVTLLTTATAWADELTVYEYEGDNKKASENVPYIFYWDEYTISQYIIPADDLSDMKGGSISAITLYAFRDASETDFPYTMSSIADVYLMELDESTFPSGASFKPKSQENIVYQGQLSFEKNGNDGKVTIEFTKPFSYSGQNLLIGFENTTPGDFKKFFFYGQSAVYSSISGHKASKENIPATQRHFIPKTTFTYTTGSGCSKPKLSVGSISHMGATLTVGGGSGTYNVQYALESSDEWQDVAQNSNETTFNLTNLSSETNYKARVKSVCDENGSSDWQVVYFTTAVIAPSVGDAWSDDFEGTFCGWGLINDTLTNAWTWGTAAGCDSEKGLYISNDGGTTNAYTNSYTMVYAAKLLYFAKGKYQFSYNWKAKGENSFDYLRVALVPASATLTASEYVPNGFSTSALPNGWIALDGGDALNEKSDWQSKDVVANVNGTYYLVFAWRNDHHNQDNEDKNPPAAIDNVSITKVKCSPVAKELSVDKCTITGATITWTGNADQWQVLYADNEAFQSAAETTVNTNSYAITGLQPSTRYYVKVRACCGGTDYGAWSEAFSFKSAKLITIFPWREDFESLSDNATIPESWDNSDGTTTDAGQKWCFRTGSEGPTVNSGHNGSRCIRFNSYNNKNGITNFLKTPLINLPASNDIQLRFWYKNPAGGDFSVYLSTDGGATYTTQLATGLTGKTEWTEKRISLADYAGRDSVVIVFKGTSNYENGDAYIYLDDVVVEHQPLTLTLVTNPANGGKVEMINTIDGVAISKDQEVDGKYYVTPGTEVTVKAIPAAGHFFKNWNDNVTTDLRTFTMNNDQSFTAIFDSYPTLTLGVTPENAGSWTILGGSDGDDEFTTADAHKKQKTFENTRFRITGETNYVDEDGLDIRQSNKIIVESLNGETITSLDVHFGYGQKNAEKMQSTPGTVNATNSNVNATVTNIDATSVTLSTSNLTDYLQVKEITIHWQLLPDGVTAYRDNGEFVKGKYYVAPGTELTVKAMPTVEGTIVELQPTDITLNEVEGQQNTWTFTMGQTAATLSANIKKPLQDSWIQDIAALTYNGSEQMPTITVKDGETVLQPWDETTQTGDYTVSYSNNKDAALSTAEDAPTVTIAAVENSDKYIGTASKSFTIGKANLEVKADDFRIGYGAESPAYTATYTGFVGDDTESVLSGTLAISCPYVQGNDVNTYTITPSGLSSSNYDITFVSGTLTVLHSVNYLDMNGKTQTCSSYYSLDGSESTLGVVGEDTWYVAEDTLNYAHGLTFNGDVHFILKDGAVMNVGTEESPVSGNGLGTSGDSHFSIDVFGQSTDADSNGQLNVYAENSPVWVFFGDFNCSSARLTLKTNYSNNCFWAMDVDNNGKGNINLKDATVIVAGQGNGIFAQGGNITIDGGKVTATANNAIYAFKNTTGGNIIINGGEVEATAATNALLASGGAVTINGGQVTANGEINGIYGDTITLGWTSLTDFVKVSSYNRPFTIADGKTFVDEDGNTYGSGSYSDYASFAGKTLRPYITETIEMNADGIMTYASEYDLDFSAVSGLTAYVATGISDNTLTLTPVDKVLAGTGLLLKGKADSTFTVPVTVSATAIDDNLLVGLTGQTDVYQTTDDGIAFILANDIHGVNWYRLAEEHCTLKANSAYLRLPASVAPSASRALTMAFEDGTTGITPASSLNGGEWYDLNGRKLDKKPTRKGLYIFNGRKTLIK